MVTTNRRSSSCENSPQGRASPCSSSPAVRRPSQNVCRGRGGVGLKRGSGKKSRLKERRDPIVLHHPAHIEMVIDHAPPMVAKIIRTALKTGARLDELKKSERNNFDRSRRQLTVIGKRNKLR